MTRKIIHIDMDCFYAAVEIRDQPHLKNLPVAVGGSAQSRGVITTANYVARQYGVKSAQPTSQALRLCPHLILIPPHFDKYYEESAKIRKIFSRYTSLIEPLSLDEAYLDVTDSPLFSGSASFIARDIRKTIFEETGLRASAGIAPNKFLAKVASDWKKPNGQFTIDPKDVSGFVQNLSLAKIPGIGKVTFQKMKEKGYEKCRDLQPLSKLELVKAYGKWGLRLYSLVRGVDEREVKTSRERKSLSVERTFSEDLKDLGDFRRAFRPLYEEFLERVREYQEDHADRLLCGFVVKMRFYDFRRITRETAIKELPFLPQALEFAEKSFLEFNEPIRLLGVGVKIRAKTSNADQMEFFLSPIK
jgi:DNA polymerase-4